MTNYDIADQLSLLSKLMDIHGENSFKSKSYASAAFAIEKLPQEISELPPQKIFAIRGIGESVGKKILELLKEGSIQNLQELLGKTPEGVLEMMNIKGLGPKKIHTLWKEMNIDSLEVLADACAENRISSIKGFGAKTQESILASIRFQQENSGKYLYARAEAFAEAFTAKLKKKFPKARFEITGDFRRQLEIVESLEWVTTVSSDDLKKFLITDTTRLVTDRDGLLIVNAEEALLLAFHITSEEAFGSTMFETSCSKEFIEAWQKEKGNIQPSMGEEEIFQKASLPFIPPARRDFASALRAKPLSEKDLVQTSSIKGLIHSHSNWSDGAHPLEFMAEELIRLGFEYLVISDHSKAAFYANGLNEERIAAQHKQIDELNRSLAPFKIFKSIECDILNDGSLDYSNDILSSFDLVITSVHSNLNMTEEKAMKRVLGAVTNPYTTIMGHMTGRLLLRRKGFPLDHRTIIDACAEHHVAIEINANPNRLDMDWRFIEYALEKNLMLSINPDAHTTDEFQNIKYGVLVAQKGGLTAASNLSSFSRQEFENYLSQTKKKKGIS